MTTPKTQIEHVKAAVNGSRCPVCDAEEPNLSFGPCEVQGIYAMQEAFCGACGHSWTDVYTLDGYSEFEDGEGTPVDIPGDGRLAVLEGQIKSLTSALEGMLEWARRVKQLNPGPEIVNACNALERAKGE